jgi:hypothetical protein
VNFENQPPVRFPAPVRDDLNAHRPGLADETEQLFAAHVRPCVAVTSRRVSEKPLRRGPLARMFGARDGAPVLGPLESKFGGLPYCEQPEDWKDRRFLGQIDLARATSVLPPTAPRLAGLLRLDLPRDAAVTEALRVKWFRAPSANSAVPASAEPVGRWEAQLEFTLSWTLPEGNALEALWPLRERPWYEYTRFFPEGYNEDGSDEFHRLLGNKSGGLDEPYGFTAPPGCGQNIAAYECLLRLTFDNAAGFGWGTNWIYLLVPAEDLARGDLSRIVVTGANS